MNKILQEKFLNLRNNKIFLFFFKFIIFIFVIIFFIKNINQDELYKLFLSNNLDYNLILFIFLTIFLHLFLSTFRWFLLINIFEKYRNFKKVYYVSIYGYLSDQISVVALFLSRYLLFENGPSFKNITISSILEKLLAFLIKFIFTIPALIYFFLPNINYILFIFLIFFLLFLVLRNYTQIFLRYYQLVKKNILFNILFYQSLFLTIILQLINISSFILIFYFFNIKISLFELLIFLPLALMISSLQIIFGQIGIRELSFFLVFQYSSISNEEILITSVFYTISYTLFLILLTFFNIILFKILKNIYN